MRYIATLIIFLSNINLATSCVLDPPPPPPQPKVVPQPPMPPEPEPKKVAPKKAAISSSACPGELDNKDITDVFKGFSYKDYLKSATSQKTDPALGSMHDPYARYKGKNGIIYDVYAVEHDPKNDLTPLVDMKKLKAGTLQRLNKVKGKCVYYTEIHPSQTDGVSNGKHAEVILLFYKSPDQKYMSMDGSNAVDGVTQALGDQSKPAKKMTKPSSKDEDDMDEEEDDATKEDDSDEDALSSKKSSTKIDDEDDSDEGSFDFGSSSDDEGDDAEDDSDEE